MYQQIDSNLSPTLKAIEQNSLLRAMSRTLLTTRLLCNRTLWYRQTQISWKWICATSRLYRSYPSDQPHAKMPSDALEVNSPLRPSIPNGPRRLG
jgi:hypothetical protein